MSPARKGVARRVGPGGWCYPCRGVQSGHREVQRANKQMWRQLERRIEARWLRREVSEGW